MTDDDRYNGRLIDRRLTTIESRLAAHLEDFSEMRSTLADIQIHLREMENWRLEVNVYFKQVRWLIVLVLAALITGVINILLNLEWHVT